ncbi:MAG TPA: SGNH/GDSL hydrolase family protein [Ilumatobacteraceae bacterium]|nr:SGNH/GDSL hydrolase family protein [Ilumatobacteraceae bacterium]
MLPPSHQDPPTPARRTNRLVVVGLVGVIVVALIVGVVLALTANGGGHQQRQVKPDEVKRYVALGDSFTAAPLVPDLALARGCIRSTNNYPALLARSLPNAIITDVSCIGAATENMTTEQSTALGILKVPPQFAALTADTDLVTVGIGGNDFDVFSNLTSTCVSVAATDPDGSPCRTAMGSGGEDKLLSKIPKIEQRIIALIAEVRARAPRSRVVMVGYPDLVPGDGTTCAALPLATGDYAYAKQVSRQLTVAVESAARAGKADYIDVWTASAGHDVCSAEPWVNGGQTSMSTGAAFHPLAAEQAAVAELILETLRS